MGGEIDGCEAGDDCRAGIFQIFPVGEKLACAAGIVRVKARWGRCNRWEKYTIYFCLKKEAFASGELSLARGLRNTRQLVAAPEGKIEFRWNKLFKMVNGLGGLEDGFFSPCRS